MAAVAENEYRFSRGAIPLAYTGKSSPSRYFIVEPGDPDPKVTVALEHEGRVIFEIIRSRPVRDPRENPASDVELSPYDLIVVTDKRTGRIVYRIRSGCTINVVFSRGDGTDLIVEMTNEFIRCSGFEMESVRLAEAGAGIVYHENGSVSVGRPVPESLRALLS